MKKGLMLFLGLLLVFSLTVIGGEVHEVKAQDEYDVAYIARAQGDSFAAWLANSIREEASQYEDINLEIFNGQADSARQNSLIENAITNQFDVIIVQPHNSNAQKPYVKKVVEAGIDVITTNPKIKGIEGSSWVDADPYMQAEVVADLAVDQVPENANVVVLKGPPGNLHADVRRESWEENFFEKRPDVEIVGEQIANWNKSEAMNYMEDWVQSNDKIDAIISMNDNMAAGALEVVKDEEQYDDILAYGVDGTAEACLLIKEGTMTATCLQNAYALGEEVMSTAHKLATDQNDQIQTNIDTPLVTKENVDKYIELHREAGNIE